MPKIYLKSQMGGSQEGYNNRAAGSLYTASGYNYGINLDRVGLVRFTNVAVPKGSTINSAYLHMFWEVKNHNQDYSFSATLWYDGRVKPSDILSNTRDEWQGAHRTWTKAATPGSQTFNWIPNTQGGYASRQPASFNAKPIMDALMGHVDWTLAGGSITFLIGPDSVSSPDNIYFHRREGGTPPVLEIDYTPPASDGKETVVNLQENCTFTSTYPWTGQPSGLGNDWPYGFNNWFGSFTEGTYNINAAGGPTAPKGGNVLRVVAASTGNMRSMVHFGIPTLEEGQWYNYSCYAWVPTGSPNVRLGLLGDRPERNASFATMTEKNQWVRLDFSFLAYQNAGIWAEMEQTTDQSGPAYSAGSVFYVANVQLTKGRQVRPYIDGSQTLTNADYGWAGKTGTNGFVRAAPPVATVNPITDVGRRKFYGVSWTYTNSAGHAQVQSEVRVRRTKN